MTTRINLPDVTLIAVTGIGYKTDEHIDAIRKSCSGIDFGGTIFVQDAYITDVYTWNRYITFELYKLFDTSHCLLIHHDGYVINQHLWKDEWLDYDYIGAPWPLPQDDYSYRDEDGEIVRVGNSVGLRSNKLMRLIAQRPLPTRFGNNNEDGNISCHNRKWLESKGCDFAPIGVAKHFSKEHEMPENEGLETFMFHSL